MVEIFPKEYMKVLALIISNIICFLLGLLVQYRNDHGGNADGMLGYGMILVFSWVLFLTPAEDKNG